MTFKPGWMVDRDAVDQIGIQFAHLLDQIHQAVAGLQIQAGRDIAELKRGIHDDRGSVFGLQRQRQIGRDHRPPHSAPRTVHDDDFSVHAVRRGNADGSARPLHGRHDHGLGQGPLTDLADGADQFIRGGRFGKKIPRAGQHGAPHVIGFVLNRQDDDLRVRAVPSGRLPSR